MGLGWTKTYIHAARLGREPSRRRGHRSLRPLYTGEEDAIAMPDAAIALSDAAITISDTAVALSDAAIAKSDTAIALSDDAMALPDAAMAQPDAALPLSHAAMALPDAAMALPDAAIALPLPPYLIIIDVRLWDRWMSGHVTMTTQHLAMRQLDALPRDHDHSTLD